MFEGKHIHFSPTDNKPLCSFSGKLCRQRRLNGYAFCIRHILEDKSAPFKQCSYVTRNNSQKCLNAIPTNQDRGYCHSHMQVAGIIPKTERKSKAHPHPPTSRSSDGSSPLISEKSLTSPATTPASSNGKKDPGAVFKFEEDSSDIADLHFPYKNGLTASLSNGKGKSSYKGHGKDQSNSSYSPKDGKAATPKTPKGFAGSFTTKKLTDKNKNVYTAIVPTSNNSNSRSIGVNSNNNNNNHHVNSNHSKSPTTKSKNKGSSSSSSSWSSAKTSLTDSTSSPSTTLFPLLTGAKVGVSSSTAAVQLDKSSKSNQKDSCLFSSKAGDSKLNKVQDVDDLRQFEQLKALNQLDKLATTPPAFDDPSSLDIHEDRQQQSLRIFPRLASSAKSSSIAALSLSSSSFSIPPHTGIPSPPESPPTPGATTNSNKLETQTQLPSPPPPVIPRNSSNNGILIKADSQDDKDKSKTGDDKDSIRNSGLSSVKTPPGPPSTNSIEPHNNLRSRHDFLAQVRTTFKSQYKSIRKSSKVSEKREQSNKAKFRESLLKCVKIDSSICAQVLLGYGLNLPAFTSEEDDKDKNKDLHPQGDFGGKDDYEFSDTEPLSPVVTTTIKAITASFSSYDDSMNSKSNKNKANGGTTAKKLSKCDGAGGKGKGPAATTTTTSNNNNYNNNVQKKTSTTQSVDAGPNIGSNNHHGAEGNKKDGDKNQNAHELGPMKPVKNGKKVEKNRAADLPKERKSKQSSRKLKRTDALPLTPESSLDSASDVLKDEPMLSPRTLLPSTESSSCKKRRLGLALTCSDTGNLVHQSSISSSSSSPSMNGMAASPFDASSIVADTPPSNHVKDEKEDGNNKLGTLGTNPALSQGQAELDDLLGHSSIGHSSRRNQGLETVLNSVGSSENAPTPDGVITDASFDSTFEHSTSSQQDCEFSEDDLEHSFELQIDPEIESQASRLLEDNVLTEADFTELFPDNRMSDHKFGRSDLQELGMGGLEFDVNDIDYSLFANIFPNFSRTGGQPESISISNQF